MISGEFDIVVVGAGNAGMCAALAARGEGARVLVLEEGLFEERRIQIAYEAKDERLIADGDGVHGV
jgi:tricarballylate dehydrogenase